MNIPLSVRTVRCMVLLVRSPLCVTREKTPLEHSCTKHRHDQRTKFLLVEVLYLIDQDRDRALPFFGRFAHCNEEIRQIDFKITAVSRSLFPVDIESDAHLRVGELERSQKTAQHPQAALHLVSRTRDSIQFEQKAAQMRGKQRPKRFIFVRLDGNRPITGSFCLPLDLV